MTSPKRLITTAAIILYYFWFFMRPLMATSVGDGPALPEHFEFPALDFLDAAIFSVFAALSLVLALGIFGYRSSFKPADVDVLFPTPVSPRVVLLFRIVRDYLATLLVPIFLVLVTWRPFNIERIFRDVPHPESAGYALRALTLGFVLVTTAWVGIGHALSLYVNRNDKHSDTRKLAIGLTLATPYVAVLGYILYSAIRFRSMADFVHFAEQGWLRVIFFTATPATKMVMGPLEGQTAESLLGAAALVALSLLGLYLALGQARWVYDQAAVRGFGAESIRQLQRKGDFMGIVAESARRGRVKVRKPGRFQSLRTHGFGSLIWKDVLIQWRSVRGMILLFLVVGILFVVMPYMGGLSSRRTGVGYMVLTMEGFVALMVATMTSQSGFTELLRRVDLQKPLPFTPQKIVVSEVVAKALPSMLIPLICSLLGLVLFPKTWPEVLAGAIFFPSISAVICSLVCVIVLLFPEIEDVSQRGFRGLMTMLGLLIVASPGVGAFVLFGILAHSAIIGAIPGALICYATAFGLTVVGGNLYAAFNPSE